MKKLALSFVLLCTLIITSCGGGTKADFIACEEHLKNCPISEDCPEHPICESHEKCDKDKDCKDHPNCEAFEHR